MPTEDTFADMRLPAGHVQRIVEPAIAMVVARAQSLAQAEGPGHLFFLWAMETGEDLLASLRQAVRGRAVWEEVPLRLNSDRLGLLAYSLNALRSEIEGSHSEDTLQRRFLDETRTRLWRGVSVTSCITCFLPRSVASDLLLTRLRSIGSSGTGTDLWWAVDLASRLQRARESHQDAEGDLVRVEAPLAHLVRLHDLLKHAQREPWDPLVHTEEIRNGLTRVLDPIVFESVRHRQASGGLKNGPPSTQAVADPVPPRGQLPPHGQRFVAHLIDTVLAFLGAMVSAFSLGFLASFADPSISDASLEDLGVLTAYASYAAYYLLTTAYLGGTPGKLLLSLRVVDERGERPGLARAFGRYLLMFFLSFLAFTWWWVLIRKDRRALHDLAAGLWVVYEPPSHDPAIS